MIRRFFWPLLLVALVLVAGALVAGHRSAGGSGQTPISSPAIVPAPPAPPGPPALARAPAGTSAAAGLMPSSDPAPPAAPLPNDADYPVNLAVLRAELPRNRYWVDSAPTRDPEVSARREREATASNQLYGKVLSGTASTEEIRTWVDQRRQISEDAIEFAQRVLSEHGSELPDRDRGLLELAIEMHRTRLAELPRQEAEARARKDEQDRRRAAWNGVTTP